MDQQSNFQEILEYKKAILKLESQLQEIELSLTVKLYEDLKRFNESLREQSNEDNIKIISLRNELQNKEKNYENQILIKKEELYQEKITKLSTYNPDGQINKIKMKVKNNKM